MTPPARHSHCAAVHHKLMYVLGGSRNIQKSDWLHDLWALNTTTHMWHEVILHNVPKAIQSGVFGRGACYIGNGYFLVIPKKNTKDIWALDIEQNRYLATRALGDVPIHKEKQGLFFMQPDKAVIYGGGKANLSDMWTLDCNELKRALNLNQV